MTGKAKEPLKQTNKLILIQDKVQFLNLTQILQEISKLENCWFTAHWRRRSGGGCSQDGHDLTFVSQLLIDYDIGKAKAKNFAEYFCHIVYNACLTPCGLWS